MYIYENIYIYIFLGLPSLFLSLLAVYYMLLFERFQIKVYWARSGAPVTYL